MKVLTSSAWGKPKLTGKAKLDAMAESIAENSEVVLLCSEKYLYIELHGPLAAIPNMKNGKITLPGGASIIGKECKTRIDSLSKLVLAEAQKQGVTLPYFADQTVSLLLIAGRKSRSFDLIGCLETIQDWLEPSSKVVGRKPKPRGWGVGVIADDKSIIPRVYHSWQTGIAHEHTVISVAPWESVKEKDMEFLAAHLSFNGAIK